MQVVTAVFQAICLLFGYNEQHDAFMKDCVKSKSETECQQLWRDK